MYKLITKRIITSLFVYNFSKKKRRVKKYQSPKEKSMKNHRPSSESDKLNNCKQLFNIYGDEKRSKSCFYPLEQGLEMDSRIESRKG